jgi:hypothetical protein
MPLEILNRAFVFLRRSLALERAEILSFARSLIFLLGIQPILPGFQFPNHNDDGAQPPLAEANSLSLNFRLCNFSSASGWLGTIG